MKEIKCIVAAENANGVPDLYFVKVQCTDEQYNAGDHYTMATYSAIREGYEPMLTYDEFDSAGKAMLPLFNWDSASVVNR